jgi:hypothetical protein
MFGFSFPMGLSMLNLRSPRRHEPQTKEDGIAKSEISVNELM